MDRFMKLTDINLVTRAINLRNVLAFTFEGPEITDHRVTDRDGAQWWAVRRPLMTVSMVDGTVLRSIFVPDGDHTVPEPCVNGSLVHKYWDRFLDRLTGGE